jgi:protein ImuB
VRGRPDWGGPLTLSPGPERIEQGWWDGMDISRDYYPACNPAGSRLWLFQDRRDRQWYLHGVFA